MKFKPGQKVRKGKLEAIVIHGARAEDGRERMVVVIESHTADVWYEDECVEVSLDQEAEEAVDEKEVD